VHARCHKPCSYLVEVDLVGVDLSASPRIGTVESRRSRPGEGSFELNLLIHIKVLLPIIRCKFGRARVNTANLTPQAPPAVNCDGVGVSVSMECHTVWAPVFMGVERKCLLLLVGLKIEGQGMRDKATEWARSPQRDARIAEIHV
jgi:hypothetical protein